VGTLREPLGQAKTGSVQFLKWVPRFESGQGCQFLRLQQYSTSRDHFKTCDQTGTKNIRLLALALTVCPVDRGRWSASWATAWRKRWRKRSHKTL